MRFSTMNPARMYPIHLGIRTGFRAPQLGQMSLNGLTRFAQSRQISGLGRSLANVQLNTFISL